MVKTKRTFLIALALTAAAYASASDSLFITGFVGADLSFVLTTFSGSGTHHADTVTEVGPLAATLDGTFHFNGYCVDTSHQADIGSSYNVNVVPLPNGGLNNSGRIAYLYQHYAAGATTADLAAGLQLAIWDVLVDGGTGLTTGSFQASADAGAMADAATDLTGSAGQTGSATWYQGLPRGANQPQDLIGPVAPVPEPGFFRAGPRMCRACGATYQATAL